MDHLTQQQIAKLTCLLLEELAALEKQMELNDHFGLSVSQRDYTGELSTIDNHPGDLASEIYERGKDIALNEHAEHQLEQIHRALENIDIGHYGLCIRCGKAIAYERLEAVPATEFCSRHSIGQTSNERPAEEKITSSPFGRSSLDERDDANAFDGEDAWQIVESWGSSNTPAFSEDPEIHDYENMFIESDELDGYVEPIESFLATDIYGHPIDFIRNKAYRKYMASAEGDHSMEIDPPED